MHRVAVAAGAAAILASCTDAPSAIMEGDAAAALYQSAQNREPVSEFDPRARFDFDVDVQGALKPGHPIHISLGATARFATSDGEIRLTLPEIASGEDTGWEVVTIPMNQELRPHIRVRRAFAAGESVRERVTLTVPEPGYYHAMVTGYAHPDTLRPDPMRTGDVSRRDFWIWVDEKGGRVTEHFDTALIAPGYRREPGPRGLEKKPSRVRIGDATIACAVYPTDPWVPYGATPGTLAADGGASVASGCPAPYDPNAPATPPSAAARLKAAYPDAGAAGTVRPVSGARYIWKVLTATGMVAASGDGTLAADGTSPLIDCGAPAGERRIQAWIYTVAQRVAVSWGDGPEAQNAGYHMGQCGGEVPVRMDPEMSHLFLNLMKSVEGHNARFGTYPPGRIYARLYADGKTYYDHDHPDRELHIFKYPSMVYGEYGVMVATHEYGHLFQDRYLFSPPDTSGLMRYTVRCATQHPPESASTFGCALGEGFADWYAVIVRESDLPTWKSKLESNQPYLKPTYNSERGYSVCTDDGSIVQGAVSALFWDIVDGGWDESHDVIQRSPRDLIDAIKWCRVTVEGRSIGYSGVDHLIFCLENKSPYTVYLSTTVHTFFPTRTKLPTAASSGYSYFSASTDFRKTWLVNLYSKRSSVGTAPNPRTSIQPEPDPEEPVNPCPGCEEFQ